MEQSAQELQQMLVSGAEKMDIQLTEPQIQQLLAYLALLIKWNKAYNLTAIRNPQEMVSKHLLDSLSIIPHIQPTDILDVGTGAGLPGIIIAIMYPQMAVTLLDSNGKKTRFLHQVKTELKLTGVTVINSRVEAYEPAQGFSQITSRAFASIQDMLQWSGHLAAEGGQFLAMKGVYPDDELAALPAGFELATSFPLKVPAEMGERHLMILRTKAA